MTDPLTAKELVEKSYEYVDRLTRECSKTLIEEYSKAHKKFIPDSVIPQIAADVVRWFEKRDKNVRLSFDSATSARPQPTQYHMKFRGSTKDADFVIDCSVITFLVPGSEYSGNPVSFVKSVVLSADKTKFTRRK